jgi:hypothetical protein
MSLIDFKKKESYKLDFSSMLNDLSAGINAKKLIAGAIISIPAIEFALSMTTCNCGCLTPDNNVNEMVSVVFIELKESQPWLNTDMSKILNDAIPLGHSLYPNTSSTLVFMKIVSLAGHSAEIFLGTLEDGLPSDITDSIYFLPGAVIISN